jgi:hypothetical protein
MAKKLKPLRGRKITIDMSEWELGDWPERIEDAIVFDRVGGTINIKIGDKQFDDAAREIAEDAIVAFFEEDLFFHCMHEGIQISDIDGSIRHLIPWSHIWLLHHHADLRLSLSATLKWMIDSVREENIEGEDEMRTQVVAFLDKALKKCGSQP